MAAECTGAPVMQLTLNSFHYSGVKKYNVALGFPRLQEVMNVTTHPVTPSMTIYFKSRMSMRDAYLYAKKYIEFRYLSSMVTEHKCLKVTVASRCHG